MSLSVICRSCTRLTALFAQLLVPRLGIDGSRRQVKPVFGLLSDIRIGVAKVSAVAGRGQRRPGRLPRGIDLPRGRPLPPPSRLRARQAASAGLVMPQFSPLVFFLLAGDGLAFSGQFAGRRGGNIGAGQAFLRRWRMSCSAASMRSSSELCSLSAAAVSRVA